MRNENALVELDPVVRVDVPQDCCNLPAKIFVLLVDRPAGAIEDFKRGERLRRLPTIRKSGESGIIPIGTNGGERTDVVTMLVDVSLHGIILQRDGLPRVETVNGHVKSGRGEEEFLV